MSVLDTLLYGYRTVLASAVAVTQRNKLNFGSGFTVADNAVTSSTDVTVSATQSITTLTLTTLLSSVLRLTSENNALSGSQNDVTIGSNTIIRVTDTSAVTWTGIAADSGRRVLLVHAVGAGGLTLVHQSASSVATNRFALPGGANVTLCTNQIAMLLYDTTMGRWLYVGSVGGDVSPITTDSTSTGTVEDWPLPPGISAVRFTNAGGVVLRTVANVTDGRTLDIINLTGAALTIVHDTGANAAYRFDLGYASNLVINDKVAVRAIYDATSARWRIVTQY